MAYTPPSSTQLPFVFTASGYTAPSGELLFEYTSEVGSFNNLNSAVQVMQLYHDETYTYVKSCPKYVVGYSDGIVQIMKGRCIFGGIRDLWSSIAGITILSQTDDLQSIVKVMRSGIFDLSANISMHLPEDIKYSIKPVHEVVTDFPGSIHGWRQSDLYSTILMHPPKDLESSLFVKRTATADLDMFIHAWQVKDLQLRIDRVFPFDLPITLSPILPANLSAYLKTRYVVDLGSNLKGWGLKDLSAYIDIIFAYDLNVKIHGRDDMFGDLYFRIKGRAIEVQKFLSASLRGVVGKDLNASLIATYMSNLLGYVFPVLPKDISANIYAWHVHDLQFTLNGQRSRWDLLASIFPNNNLSILGATICSRVGTKIPSNLPANIHSWYASHLTSNIGVIASGNLQAVLIPFGYSANFSSSIYPKMVRLTAIIKVATMEHKDLSAMINSFCVYTNHKNLTASLYTIYKSDLSSYVRALKYSYKPFTLSATVGYADTITQVDKYKINFTIAEGSMTTFDRYTIGLTVFSSVKHLSSYIRGIMQSVSLGSSIKAELLEEYDFGKIANTEPVIQLSYDGIFKGSAMVELSFESLVKDYYYSTDGDYAWKTDRLDRWILDLTSYLPRNIISGLRRRLHKSKKLYDLKRFSSIDEAMRHAIVYVTEYPQSDLSNSIYCIGTYTSLGSIISPLYIKSDNAYLSSEVFPVEPKIIVGIEQNGIEII